MTEAPLILTYAQALTLMKQVNAVREAFQEPIANGPISASFERGALAALSLVDDILRCASLLPLPAVAETESSTVLVGGPLTQEIERCVVVE